MFKKAKPFFIIVETPLHCGSGTEVGFVDLPIQRERHTNFPKIEASTLKGAIRESFENSERQIQVGSKTVKVSDKNTIFLSFGPEEGAEHAGALGFAEARLLLFPVKSVKDVFALVSCPYVIQRFIDDMRIYGKNLEFIAPSSETVSEECNLLVKNDKIVLEEYLFTVKKDQSVTKLAQWLSDNIFPFSDEYKLWRDKIRKSIVIVSDDAFRDFVTLSTEVITRTKIDNTKGTVQSGALFTEEYLPVNSILYSSAFASPIFLDKDGQKGIFKQNGFPEEDLVAEYFVKGIPDVIQVGGNATIGKGIVRIKLMEV